MFELSQGELTCITALMAALDEADMQFGLDDVRIVFMSHEGVVQTIYKERGCATWLRFEEGESAP